MALVLVDVEQGDRAAVGDQVLGDGMAEAGGATGDDGLDVGKLHGNSVMAGNSRRF
jgi:hypothetical protein